MYLPRAFHQTDEALIRRLLAECDFATLAVCLDGRVEASPLPVVFATEGPLMARGHVAIQNPIASAIRAGAEASLHVTGANAYLSPDWYVSEHMVPTWNYLAVHLHGRLTALEGADLAGVLDDLSARHEARLLPKEPWTSAKMPEKTLAALHKAILGFRLDVARVEPKWKLSQNRKPEDRAGAVAGLRARGDADSLAIARLMEERT